MRCVQQSARGEQVVASTFAPNSDSYVSVKLNDSEGRWSFQKRVGEFLDKDAGTVGAAYVDDITGIQPPERSISECAVDTISHRLGIAVCEIVLVVGTDQISSMRPHLDQNRAICVLRPGWESVVNQHSEESWFREAVADERY